MADDRTTVGRMVRVLKSIDAMWAGGAKFEVSSNGRVTFCAWDDARNDIEIRKFDNARDAVNYYERVARDAATLMGE